MANSAVLLWIVRVWPAASIQPPGTKLPAKVATWPMKVAEPSPVPKLEGNTPFTQISRFSGREGWMVRKGWPPPPVGVAPAGIWVSVRLIVAVPVVPPSR